MKKAFIYFNYPNVSVLQMYLSIIEKTLKELQYSCKYVDSLEGVNKKDLIIFPMGNDAFKYYFKGYRNFVLWQQGVTSEESFMRHSSNIRRVILNAMDCFAMKKAKAILYVSSELEKYYEKHAHCSFSEKSYIMPCFNENEFCGTSNDKDYSQFHFAYVGSLAVWQCFEQTLRIYKEIEAIEPSSYLKILTFEKEKATQMAKEAGLHNYEVKTVAQQDVKKELADISYGFIIRENSIVNTVSTPTKLSSYLAAGVLPIFSACLGDFKKESEGLGIALPVYNIDPQKNARDIVADIMTCKDKEQIDRGIRTVFNRYYSIDFHMNRIRELFAKVLEEKVK